jgi:2-polyprenyl-3-methyl-5-hydroxy-6-metoxy-1,4-benzoquinol methylase
MALKPLLKGCREYYGTDFVPSEGVFECNLEEGLTGFKDNSYDIVCALDVLEHLEHAHKVFEEAQRVARKAVFVSLPNMYYIKFRMNYLSGRLSGKYDFPVKPIMDRHRWVLSYTDAERFIRGNASNQNVTAKKIIPERGRTKAIAEPIETFLGENFPDLFAYGSLFMIKLDKSL